MSGRALLYGATGYTGRAIAQQLAHDSTGELDLLLAGRDAAKVRALAEPLGLPWRAFDLTAPGAVAAALADVQVVLHAAGPFAQTAQPMIDGCLATGTHYLDLGGEWPVFCAIMARDAEARDAGIALLPGVGLTVAATDCLLAKAVESWPDTVRLCLGISAAQVVSRGSVATMASLAEPGTVVRRGGRLVTVPAGSLTRMFDFGKGPSEAVATNWADVVTGGLTTGVPDIEVYSEMHWSQRAGYRAAGLVMGATGAAPFRALGGLLARAWPDAPDAGAREAARFTMVVEALDPWRRVRRMTMHTLDGYGASVLIACEALRRVLAGGVPDGFSTPARAFGSNFAVEAGAALLAHYDRSTAA